MQRSRNYKGINYYRYRVTIPARIIEELGLEKGDALEVCTLEEKIVIKRLEGRTR